MAFTYKVLKYLDNAKGFEGNEIPKERLPNPGEQRAMVEIVHAGTNDWHKVKDVVIIHVLREHKKA